MLQIIRKLMIKNSALCVNFCCVQFAMLYLQNHSFMLKIIYVAWQNYMWHCQIQLLTFTIELFFRHDFSLGSNFHKVPYNN